MNKLAFLPILCTFALNAQTTERYDLADLEVLVRDKNYDEFLAHVNDIRPSLRQKHWKEMYQSMATLMLEQKIKQKDYSQKAFNDSELHARSSSLMEDVAFQLKRSQYATSFFKQCYKASQILEDNPKKMRTSDCDQYVARYWDYSNKDPEVGVEIASILKENNSHLNLWSFVQKATIDSVAPIYCAQPAVQDIIKDRINQDIFNKSFNGNYKSLLDNTLTKGCFGAFKQYLKATLDSHMSTGLDKELALNLLSATKSLTPEEMAQYSTVFLLDEPVVGERMNLAWMELEKLGTNYKGRLNVLENIKKMPIVPDRIFKDPGNIRNKAIINHVNKNFPEFLSYYSESCYKFLNSKEPELINLSSSLQCREFFKTAQELKKSEKTEWITDSIESKLAAPARK